MQTVQIYKAPFTICALSLCSGIDFYFFKHLCTKAGSNYESLNTCKIQKYAPRPPPKSTL